MTRNSIFFKIIIIFILPAIGMFVFNAIFLMDKISSLKEIYKADDNLEYIKLTQKVIYNIQRERTLSIIYNESKKYKNELDKQRKSTNILFEKYLKYISKFSKEDVSNLGLENFIKQIQDRISQLNDVRSMINKFDLSNNDIMNKYNSINMLLLGSVFSLKYIKSSINFHNEFLNIYNFLAFKEEVAIENALVSVAIMKEKVDDKLEKEMTTVSIQQKINFEYFHVNSAPQTLDIYNKEMLFSFSDEIEDIVKNIKQKLKDGDLTIEKWLEISSVRQASLDRVFDKFLVDLKEISRNAKNDGFVEKNVSLLLLFASCITFVILLIVLRKIILEEKVNFEKVAKQKKVYELLNDTNKYLLKKDNKKDLYYEIHNIISKNPTVVFSFIYDLEEEENNRIYAPDGAMRNLLVAKLEEYKKTNSDNLLTRAINMEKIIIIGDFLKSDLSVFSSYAKKFNIKSSAVFPIRKFNEIVSVLLIYSNEFNFFEPEVEVLFDKMTGDMSHSLERFEYDALRLSQEAQLRISSVAFESSEPMFITDKSGVIINVNHAFCDVMAYSRDTLLGKDPKIFNSSLHNDEFFRNMWTELKRKGSWKGEVHNRKGNGDIIPQLLTITAIKDKNDVVTNYLAQYIDISEQKNHQKALEYQATHDILTGLPNRLLLTDRIEHALIKAKRHNFIGALIFIDLDNFKTINDTLGHDIGDALLIMVSNNLREAVRDEDTVSRIGGDEFIVLADNIGSNFMDAKSNALVLANKIKDAVNKIEYIEGYKNISTPSIGVTLFDQNSPNVKEIIKQADSAMYDAKKVGKNTVQFL